MDRTQVPAPHPANLRPGAVVGPWRVVGWLGRGVHGTVYKAVRVGQEQAGPVALKVAMMPGDPRFAQEAELLRRLHHPSLPRLEDAGEWLHASGEVYPYLAMEFLEGLPLYEWARRNNPTQQQVSLHLAQLAGALAVLQAQQCVHRDVKGDNVLVRLSDGRAFLTDFGTGYYPGAATLTPPLWFPGTPAYRAPESRQFELRFGRDSCARYRAGPADDLYALGVTTYRLLTGRYPEIGGPREDEAGNWQWEAAAPPAPHMLNPRVEPRLSALCLRMLAVRPEARGTAAQMAEALEAVAHGSAVLERPPGARNSAGPISPRGCAWPWRRGGAAAAAVLMLAGGSWWAVEGGLEQKPSMAQQETGGGSQKDDEDTAGLGEAASSVSAHTFPAPSAREVLTEEPQLEPVEGQTKPDAKGRCPEKWQVALNGGCWAPLRGKREACEVLGGQFFKGTCYGPVTKTGRPPTSSPAREP
jgi:predicted Ser/Thr protein kinase